MYFQQRPPACANRRRAVILLIVLVLLTLFAIIGLAFVLYSSSEADASRIYRESWQVPPVPDVTPETAMAYFLRSLVYDESDDSGIDSAMRGHGLLRSMYGLNYTVSADGTIVLENNTVPFNGTGRLHTPSAFGADLAAPPEAKDDYYLVNYTYCPDDGFLRDPERPGTRSDPLAPRQPFVGGFNAPYTYPDLNNMFLAAVKADGTVLLPSFHRPWTGFGPLDPTNPTWTDTTQPWLKYQVLRPRPADHPAMGDRPGFPLPQDAGGDVKNLLGAPGGNDSIWMDLGYPALTAPDGRKYKPLFAPLIVDLDGRVNLNVHGNVRGAAGGHMSNQGWGSWEVGLDQVLTADADEWKNLFRGAAGPNGSLRALGRYGPDQQPTPNGPLPEAQFGAVPHSYAPVDFDGSAPGGTPTGPLQLPGRTQSFPLFPAGYDNASLAERTNHPSLYQVLGAPGRNAAGYDTRFDLSNMPGLLSYTKGGETFTDVMPLCPKNFADPRIRHLVTTDSADVDRPGVVPWVMGTQPDSLLVRDSRYPYVPEKLGGGLSRPFPAPPFSGPYSEFGLDGRATSAALGRIDLDRPLPDYPAPDPTTGLITDAAGFGAAQAARQQLARDLFLRLIKVTGAYDPTTYLSLTTPSNPTPPSLTDVNTLRWLAQFSVNVVDFIDTDDCITPFNWGRAVGTPESLALLSNEWVFGTELPRVVVNEVYAEYVNAPGETGSGRRATKYLVNVWAELYNPLRADATLSNGGAAPLDRVYQLVLTRPNNSLLSPTDPTNVLGDPDDTRARQAYSPQQVHGAFSAFGAARVPTSDDPAGGFCVIGPASPVLGVNSWDPGPNFCSVTAPAMSYQVRVLPGKVTGPPNPTLLLRRLACPGLPWQPDSTLDPATKPYNPYVTVDFVSGVPLNSGITNDGAGFPNRPLPLARRRSFGRREPYDANATASSSQAPAPPLAGKPQHTFVQTNAPRQDPFHWLVHLDRPPVSPMELLHVSCCKPHQLTHLFRDSLSDNYQSFNHAPYWLLRDPTCPLSRIFEFLETHCRAGGVVPGGRIPGQVNLNTVWDPETFRALCNAQPSNYFSAGDVDQIYAWLAASRTPGGAPGRDDRPFKSLGNAHFTTSGDLFPVANGLDDTLFRANPNHPAYDAATRPIRLFEVVKKDLSPRGVIEDHPYQRYELLTKLFNQVTTRSNIFAVWVTVGFFEVNDASTRPVKLGAELGRGTGQSVRYRMFAIVDRSNPVSVFPGPGAAAVTSPTAVPGPGPATVTPTLMRLPPRNGLSWTIQPGAVLRVSGVDGNGTVVSEDVVVTAVTGTTFTATFSRGYPNGFTSISAYGNPGPRGGSPLVDRASVVRYCSFSY